MIYSFLRTRIVLSPRKMGQSLVVFIYIPWLEVKVWVSLKRLGRVGFVIHLEGERGLNRMTQKKELLFIFPNMSLKVWENGRF